MQSYLRFSLVGTVFLVLGIVSLFHYGKERIVTNQAGQTRIYAPLIRRGPGLATVATQYGIQYV